MGPYYFFLNLNIKDRSSHIYVAVEDHEKLIFFDGRSSRKKSNILHTFARTHFFFTASRCIAEAIKKPQQTKI